MQGYEFPNPYPYPSYPYPKNTRVYPYSCLALLNINNQGAINYSNNTINHSHTKHIDIQHHFVCEKLVSNKMQLQYCTTDDDLLS